MTYTLYQGDCLEVMPTLEANSVDTVITDPPYGLSFMGKDWDHGVPGVQFWREALRVARPGAMLLAFGGTRTFHRLTCAIEDAGWEVRDVVSWLYGQGFPKGHDIYKNIKTCNCTDSAVPYSHESKPQTQHNLRPVRETHLPQTVNATDERGQILQPFVSEQDAQGTWSEFGEGAQGGSEYSLEGRRNLLQDTRQLQGYRLPESAGLGETDGAAGRLHNGASAHNGSDSGASTGTNGSSAPHQPRPNRQPSREFGTLAEQQHPQESRMGETCPRCGKPLASSHVVNSWQGWNVALKPAWEPIILAMKPLDGTFADNAQRWGVAGLNVDGARIPTDELLLCHDGQNKNANTYGGGWNNYELGSGRQYRTGGRWPANLLLDEDAARALDAVSGITTSKRAERGKGIDGPTFKNVNGQLNGVRGHDDAGGASRFFYVAKASRSDRGHDNTHPTVKPLALMRYLCRLTSTPTGGIVLDPFMGSGTTGVACVLEGRQFVGIDLDPHYCAIAERRIAMTQPALIAEDCEIHP